MNAGLTAMVIAASVVMVVLVVAGGVLTPKGTLSATFHRHPTGTSHATRTAYPGPHHRHSPTPIPPIPPAPTRTVTRTVTPDPTGGPTTTPPTSGNTTGSAGPVVQAPKIGVYMAGNNAGLDSYTAGWPAKPNVASFYLNWNSSVPSLMKTYAGQGREIQAELATKTGSGSWVTWADVASGTYDAHIISLIHGLDALGVPVMLSLDNEPDAKATSGTGEVAPGQTAAQYVAAANHVADLIHANSTHVQSLVWLAGFKDAATSASFLPAHSKLDNVGWDPYMTGTHATSETPTQLFATFINTVLIPNGYGDIPRHILETGIKTDAFSNGKSFSTTNQIGFFAGIPAAMAADNIDSVIWFRDDSGAHDYVPTDASVDKAFAAMVLDLLQ